MKLNNCELYGVGMQLLTESTSLLRQPFGKNNEELVL